MWDYLIKSVRTIDPKNHIDDDWDIAIENGKKVKTILIIYQYQVL